MTGHDDALDSVALLALGVLPESEARAVAEHARTCEACAAEYAELRAAADALAFSAELIPGEPDEVSAARMKGNVMGAVRASLQAPAIAAPSSLTQSAAQTASLGRSPAGTSRRTAWTPYMLAAAAVIVAFISTTNVATISSQRADAIGQVARLRAQLDVQTQAADRGKQLESRLAEVTAPGSKHFAVPNGEVVTSGGHVFLALRVAPLAPGKVYQAWALHAGAHAAAPSVTFVPGSDGVAFIELPESSRGLAAVAVSVEPVGGSKAPTTTPSFVRALS